MTPFEELTARGRIRRLRELALKALESYELAWTRVRLLGDFWNVVFRVDTPRGPLALRVMRRDTEIAPRKVGSEAEFVDAIASSTDIPVARVIPNRFGEPFTLAEAPGVPGPRSCVLFGWVPGDQLDRQVTAPRWTALGELMAKMHRASSSWQPSPAFGAVSYDSVLAYGDALVLFEPGGIELLGLRELLLEAYAVTAGRIAAIRRERESLVIHGDLHAENVNVHRGVLIPFDFEDLLWGARILDVATSLFYVRDRSDFRALAAAFKAGYERHAPWVEHEPGEVDRLIIARGLDMLNFLALYPELEVGDREAFVRRRELPALVAVGAREPVTL